MFTATIVFGPTPTPLVLNFKTLDAAILLGRQFEDFHCTDNRNTLLHVADDFGQSAALTRPLYACVISDLDQQIAADIERALVGARTQAKAQTAAQNDPALKAAMLTGRGVQLGGPMAPRPFQ